MGTEPDVTGSGRTGGLPPARPTCGRARLMRPARAEADDVEAEFTPASDDPGTGGPLAAAQARPGPPATGRRHGRGGSCVPSSS
ncbi:hypothetical protein [Streptomyces sp. enrichment culture]|uniref:hypothetical protein n=1 Tax=Streptomyces sp. enrichment culture TaxID=1795815 RepID=UPI003F56DDC0